MNITEGAKLYFKAKGVNHLRLVLKKSGCGGTTFSFEPWSEPFKTEMLVIIEGIGFLIETKDAPLVIEGTIDYVSAGMSSYLTIIDNPNEQGRCGCGTSINFRN